MQNNYRKFNKSIVKLLRLIIIISIVTNSIFTCYNLFFINIVRATENSSSEWQIMLNITETDGANDFLILGEKLEASDGKDQFDLPKPPFPQPPYIYSWFTTSLDSPYDILWKDYRGYLDANKIWNLTIIWSSDTSEQTNITISWDKSELDTSGYNSIILIASNNVDMTKENNYQFKANSNEPYNFQISLKNKILNGISNTDEQTTLLILILLIIILIIIIITLYIKKIKK